MRGQVRFLQMIKLVWNFVFPRLKEQCITPKGVKLLPVADLHTNMF